MLYLYQTVPLAPVPVYTLETSLLMTLSDLRQSTDRVRVVGINNSGGLDTFGFRQSQGIACADSDTSLEPIEHLAIEHQFSLA